jgi:hypothetical protein
MKQSWGEVGKRVFGTLGKGLWNFREGPWELYSSKGPFDNFIPPLLGFLETTRVT